MSRIYKVDEERARRARIGKAEYEETYRRSIEDNEGYWAEQAGRLDWGKPFTQGEKAAQPSTTARSTPATTASTGTWKLMATTSRSCGRRTIPPATSR